MNSRLDIDWSDFDDYDSDIEQKSKKKKDRIKKQQKRREWSYDDPKNDLSKIEREVQE